MKKLLCAATVLFFGLSCTTSLQAQTSTAASTKSAAKTAGATKAKSMPRAGAGCTSRAAQMSGKTC